ncbi:MAG TPA: hypothetical protein VFV23_06150 [Verrucomicrobiae bacterium]|nr:hypothetical protein [Verrucomicrobiae bacterium]
MDIAFYRTGGWWMDFILSAPVEPCGLCGDFFSIVVGRFLLGQIDRPVFAKRHSSPAVQIFTEVSTARAKIFSLDRGIITFIGMPLSGAQL